jgi:hypothetical protein
VALLEFFLAAAWARVVATDVLECIAHRFLRRVVAVRAVHMAVVMIVGMAVVIMIMIAVRAMNMGLLGHLGHSAH